MNTDRALCNFRKVYPYLLLVVVLIAYGYTFLHVRETADDTFIFLRYARNFLRGKGLVFNPGERVEGYTGFLWLMLESLLMRLGAGPLSSAKALGFVSGAGTLVFMFALSRAVFGNRLPGFLHAVPAALLVSYHYYAYWCAQGMEGPLFSFFVVGGIFFYIRERSGGSSLRTSVFFALAALTRPEGALLFGITFAHRSVVSRLGRRPFREDLVWAAPFALVYALFIGWRYSYYGHLLPNTYYAKSSLGMTQAAAGWGYLKAAVMSLGIYSWAFVLGLPLVMAFSRRMSSGYYYILSLTAVSLAYIIGIGGDIQPYNRFFVHFLPVVFLGFYVSVAEAFLRLGGWMAGRRQDTRRRTALMAAAVSCVFIFMFYSFSEATADYSKHNDTVQTWAAVGKWIRENSPEGAVIAVTAAGATPYYADRYTIDMLGLTDEYIAHHPDYTVGETQHEKKYNSSYVLSKKPDFIVFRMEDWPRANCETDLYNRAEFRDAYMPLNISAGDKDEDVFALYWRMPDRFVRRSGSGYIKGLGVLYGYEAGECFNANVLKYLNIEQYIEKINPNQANHFKKAVFYIENRWYDRARDELEKEAKINPDFALTYQQLAIVYHKLGDERKSYEMLTEYLRKKERFGGVEKTFTEVPK